MRGKVIHCVWLGGPKTELARKCRASWERFAPDWEIREWGLERSAGGWRVKANGREVGPVQVPRYVQSALASRKWAFAADWLRFVALEREGGIYFDFDVELVRRLDGLPDDEWVAGEWICNETAVGMNPCAIALNCGSRVAGRMLSAYDSAEFTIDRTVGDLMAEAGVEMLVLPPEVFCPSDHCGRLHVTAQTVGVHHYALSWITPRRRLARWLNWHGLGWVTDILLAVWRRLKR